MKKNASLLVILAVALIVLGGCLNEQAGTPGSSTAGPGEVTSPGSASGGARPKLIFFTQPG